MTSLISNENEVIMVDDNEADLRIAQRCYNKSGRKNPWLSFSGGEALIRYLDRVKEKSVPMPACILLDINMPCMTGFEVLTSVRRHPAFKNLPMLVMLTGSRNEIDIEKSKKCGADGYFMKPTELDDYISFFQAFKTGDFSHCA